MFRGKNEPLRALSELGGLAFTMAALVVVGALLGHYLDRRWGTTPWLTLVGTLLGVASGMFYVVVVAQRISGDDSGADQQ